MPAGWIGLEYHVFLNNIFLMINWPRDVWAGMESRLDIYRPLGRRHLPIGLPEADKAPKGAAKCAISPIGCVGADK